MDIQDIDHVEFYVGDAQHAAYYLCNAFGFQICGQSGPETGQPDQRSLLLRQRGVQIVLTSALTSRHPAAEYVKRHGDGVAVIAMSTSDARTAFAEAVRAGVAPLGQPTVYESSRARAVIGEVAGFGDVAHRFVERHGATEEFLPGVTDILAPDPEGGGGLLHRIDHAAVCLPAGELAATARFYQHVFGFAQVFEEYIEVGSQAMDSKVVQSPSGQVTFTLIEPDTRRSPGQIDAFLAAHGGAGVQHLAFLTQDIVTSVHALRARGVRFLKTPGSYYDGLQRRLGPTGMSLSELRETGVLVDRDHWGEVFQIFTQSMHVRRTYFMEIIDRHGARTFGSGNIKALYEAVDRDQKDVTIPA